MKLTTTLIFAFIAKLCFGQSDFSFNKGGTDQKNYYSVVQYENVNEKIVLNIHIKGKAYKFILDTGAPTTISSKLFDELKPSIINKISISDANQSKDSMTLVTLDEITVGDIVFKEIPTLVAKPNVIFDCFGIDGFIGSNLLRNSILQIDNNHKKVIITDDVYKLNLSSKHSSKMFLDAQSGPYIWVELKNKKRVREQLLFDSGAQGFYDVSLKKLNFFNKYNIFEKMGKGMGSNAFGLHGLGKDTTIYRLRLPVMKLNGSKLLNITTETTLDNNSRIGASLLKYGVVTVDYKNKKFYFNAYTTTDIDASTKQFPVSIVPKNGKLYISIVWDNNLTEKISVGDQVIAINGISYENVNICDLLLKSIMKGKDKIILTTKNNAGQNIETSMERK